MGTTATHKFFLLFILHFLLKGDALMKRVKSVFLPFLLVLCLGLLTGCFRATALKEPYAQIMQAFENGGF